MQRDRLERSRLRRVFYGDMSGSSSSTKMAMGAQWVVEEAPELNASARQSCKSPLYTAIVTLTLGVLGSTILPVPFAISKIGVVWGALTMLVVAAVNDRTCIMLVRASTVTGRYGYEQLAEWAGGKPARRITQVSLILLLYGTLCGGLAFLSDVARMMALKGFPGAASSPTLDGNTDDALWQQDMVAGHSLSAVQRLPISAFVTASGDGIWTALVQWWNSFLAWALPTMQADGRPVMLVVVATILYPLCLQRHIRQFEKAATVGVVVVVALMIIIVAKAVMTGFPAVVSGELPVWSFHRGAKSALPEAFAVLGFAFYMQPMLMPLLAEMPPGEHGRLLSEKAVHIVLYGVACAAYGIVGVFGAATYGDQTESNIMVNDLLAGHPTGTLCLYASLLVYLCCGMVTTHYALRASLEVLLYDTRGQLDSGPRVMLTTFNLVAALAVAVSFPTQAERIFALTGCTAVCLVCYVIPVFIHFKLHAAIDARGRHEAHVHGHDSEALAARAEMASKSQRGLHTPLLGGEGQGGPVSRASTDGSPPELLLVTTQPQVVVLSSGSGSAMLVPAAASTGLPVEHSQLLAPLLESKQQEDMLGGGVCSRRRRSWAETVDLVVMPAVIVLVGVGCSTAGLWVAGMDVYRALTSN